MLSLVVIEWLFAILVLIVFTNRYIFGSLLRLSDGRTTPGFGKDPMVWPRVAIVVPVFNEGPSVRKTAASFAALDYPRDRLRVVFVDDCSTDGTYDHLKAAQADFPWMDVQKNPRNMGKRLGIKNAVLRIDSELVLSVDSDVIVEDSSLKNLVRHMYASGADAVGGCVFVSNADENWLTRMQAVKYWIGYQFLKNLENAFDHVMCLSGCLTLYKRAALLSVDADLEQRTFLGDEVKYGEDRFLTRKLVERGYRTRLCFTSRCFTKAPATIRNYLSQQLRWRRSNTIDFITAIPHMNRFNPVVLVHYISIAFLLFFYPLFLVSQIVRLGFVVPMLEHALLVTAFALPYELNKHKLPEFARTSGIWFLSMAFVFPVMYITLTPLAIATLGTTSWETRGAKPAAKAG
ncbi:glycosyltransferase family 2 protein [Aestuariivirga sp.]|uniref:glycosyltransferase family 2 protein n=1 Tax=Aestuariivirga sp. TaxID=2650926 RepID=UPI0035942AB3